MDGYETPVTLTRTINNSKVIIKKISRGRQRGKQEALPQHHGAWQFSKSNTILKYSVVQRGPTKLIVDEYFCRSNYTFLF